MENLTAEAKRYFRLYEVFCLSPGEDTVNDLLQSAYRLHERLKKINPKGFFEYTEFHILKALRNLFTHESEIEFDLKGIHPEIIHLTGMETPVVCLIPEPTINDSFKKSSQKSI